MKYKEEAPCRIDEYTPSGFSTFESRRTILEAYKKNSKLLESYADNLNSEIKYPLMLFENRIIYLIKDDDIKFWLEYREDIIYGHKATIQIGIWRDKSVKGSLNLLATHVFWIYILERTGIAATSESNTSDSEIFWMRRVKDALNHTKYYIYCIDFSDKENKFYEVTNQNWLTYYADWLWDSRDSNCEDKRVLISKTKLA